MCILTAFAVIMYHLQIVNVEEDFLLATFGNEYLQYKKKSAVILVGYDNFQFIELNKSGFGGNLYG